jgi:Family of unknown function (DUF5681)
MAEDRNKVGFGRPPVHTRFQPGKSGNPSGSRKKSKDINARLKEAAEEKVEVQEGGRKRKREKIDLAMKQMMNKAAQGQPTFVKMALKEYQSAEASEPSAMLQEPSESDLEVIALVVHRIRQQRAEP